MFEFTHIQTFIKDIFIKEYCKGSVQVMKKKNQTKHYTLEVNNNDKKIRTYLADVST